MVIHSTELIRGKVAKILNSREVALNIGTLQGVELGMCFDILSTKGNDIRDPDTGDVLGNVDLAKAKVRVSRVYEKVCVASTYRTKRVNVGGSGMAVTSIFEPPKWVTRYETLKTRGSFENSGEDIDEEDSYVSPGDPVVQVIEESDGE